jgi:hypothetical protein
MLQVNLVIEDAKISLDELQEEIAEIEEYVQSTDVAGMSSLSLKPNTSLTYTSHAKALEQRSGSFCTSTGLENECITYNATLGNSACRPWSDKGGSHGSVTHPFSLTPGDLSHLSSLAIEGDGKCTGYLHLFKSSPPPNNSPSTQITTPFPDTYHLHPHLSQQCLLLPLDI